MELNSLSIRQPWAWAILNMGKNIENRTWKTNFRGNILIHASNTFDHEGYERLKELSKLLGVTIPPKGIIKAQSGGFCGVVKIVGCEMDLQGNIWKQENHYGFMLENPKKIKFIPHKGRLGIFKVECTNANVLRLFDG